MGEVYKITAYAPYYLANIWKVGNLGLTESQGRDCICLVCCCAQHEGDRNNYLWIKRKCDCEKPPMAVWKNLRSADPHLDT